MSVVQRVPRRGGESLFLINLHCFIKKANDDLNNIILIIFE